MKLMQKHNASPKPLATYGHMYQQLQRAKGRRTHTISVNPELWDEFVERCAANSQVPSKLISNFIFNLLEEARANDTEPLVKP